MQILIANDKRTTCGSARKLFAHLQHKSSLSISAPNDLRYRTILWGRNLISRLAPMCRCDDAGARMKTLLTFPFSFPSRCRQTIPLIILEEGSYEKDVLFYVNLGEPEMVGGKRRVTSVAFAWGWRRIVEKRTQTNSFRNWKSESRFGRWLAWGLLVNLQFRVDVFGADSPSIFHSIEFAMIKFWLFDFPSELATNPTEQRISLDIEAFAIIICLRLLWFQLNFRFDFRIRGWQTQQINQ